MGQSTNDVYPTALKIAAWSGIRRLTAAMAAARRLRRKGEEFADVLKMGRTQLQDAVPMTLGQEFGTYALMLAEDEARLGELREPHLRDQHGRDRDRHRHHRASRIRRAGLRVHLREITRMPLVTAPTSSRRPRNCGAFVQLSGVLKRVAVKLSKTCNDLRLLSSGPRAGFNEINLPARQAGSSIMPGKVNPVIPEVVNQVAFEVIGNDVTITMAAEAGQLQLNAFEPVIFYSLGRSISHLAAACLTLERTASAASPRTGSGCAPASRTRSASSPRSTPTSATPMRPRSRSSTPFGRGVTELVLEKG